MDLESYYQESYFAAFKAVIAVLDRKAWNFDLQVANLRHALLITPTLTLQEKRDLQHLLNAKALS